MVEKDWLEGNDPYAMLDFARGNTTDRKLRLFACAWFRCIVPQLPDMRSRHILATAERYADGRVKGKKLKICWASARRASREAKRDGDGAAESVHWFLACLAEESITMALRVALPVPFPGLPDVKQLRQLQLLREVVGNSFRPVVIDPAWLTWGDGTVVKLAQAAYADRALPSGELDRVRLAVLADALEEAGCSNGDIVEHLRSPGPHVRGCWVIDQLLGKE